MDNYTQVPLFGFSLREAAHAYVGKLPQAESPRERIERCGAGALSTAELLALMGLSLPDAQHLLAERRGLVNLVHAPSRALTRLPGVGPALAARIQAALELGTRALAVHDTARRITCPADAFALFRDMALLEQEELRVATLDTKNQVLRAVALYRGSVNTTLVRIGEILRVVVQDNAVAFFLAHNHPSGDPSPSPEDVTLTRNVVEAGQVMDVELLDHLIIGRGRFVSLKERGLGFS